MSQFIVFRAEKHKSAIGLRNSLKHAMREQPTPNADPKKLKDNHYFKLSNGGVLGKQTVESAMEYYQSKLPSKVRKNAVHCVEFIVSGSPEQMAKLDRSEQIKFFSDATDYIAKKMGGLKNVIHAQVHFDELTPHLTLFVVPIDEKGKLNARKFIGGSKNVMRDMQTEIAEKVGKIYGFERGIAKEKPDNHIEIKKFYQVLNGFDKFLNDRTFVPSDEFMDKLSKDVLLLLKKDETLENISAIKKEMKDIQKKWDKWAKNKGLTATVEGHAKNRMYFTSVREAGEPENVEFERNALRYRQLMDSLNDKLFPIENIIKETEKDILQNVKMSGIGAIFGMAKPEDFIPKIIQFFHKRLTDEVGKRKKIREAEIEEKNNQIENERKVISEQRLKLEEAFSKEKKLEIERLKSELVKKNEELERKNKEIQNLTDRNKDLIENVNNGRSLNNQLYEKVNALAAENQQIKQNLNNPDYLAKRYEEITETRAKVANTNRMSFKM